VISLVISPARTSDEEADEDRSPYLPPYLPMLWSGSEAVTVKDCSEQSDVLMFKERALRTQFEDGRETFVNRSGVSCCIVSRGIEDAVWFDGMFAKSGGPSLRDGVRTAEQTRVCSHAGEPS
jgi:hypothetical protein